MRNEAYQISVCGHMRGEGKEIKRRTSCRFSKKEIVTTFFENVHLCNNVARDTDMFEIDFGAQMMAAKKEEQHGLQSLMQKHVCSKPGLNAMIAFGSYYIYICLMCVVDMSEERTSKL